MNFQQLTSQLYDSNPQKRIEALRVLAMVEETRALNAIALLYKTETNELVRAVAKWAGSIIWEAQQRGHTTEAAMQAHFSGTRQKDVEEIIIEKMTRDTLANPEEDDKLKNQLDMARARWEQIESLNQSRKSATQLMDNLSAQVSDDDIDLLDAGLLDL